MGYPGYVIVPRRVPVVGLSKLTTKIYGFLDFFVVLLKKQKR